MRVGIVSDIHSEFHQENPGWIPKLPGNCDVIMIAGDISTGPDVIASLKRISKAHPDTQIIWVAGNHDFYHTNIEEQYSAFRTACQKLDRIHFLENEHIKIGRYFFFGCTLWTNFTGPDQAYEALAKDHAQHFINDFKSIKKGDRLLDPNDIADLHDYSKNWLRENLKKYPNDQTIVLTHFPPSVLLKHRKYEVTPATYYFNANCDELINEFEPGLWVFGHTHDTQELVIGKTKLISNQHGYPFEGEMSSYKPLVIELE